MPVLDTCTEVTARLLQLPGVVEEGSSYNIDGIASLFMELFSGSAQCDLLMWRQLRVVFLNNT
jgi:hypothetical protein